MAYEQRFKSFQSDGFQPQVEIFCCHYYDDYHDDASKSCVERQLQRSTAVQLSDEQIERDCQLVINKYPPVTPVNEQEFWVSGPSICESPRILKTNQKDQKLTSRLAPVFQGDSTINIQVSRIFDSKTVKRKVHFSKKELVSSYDTQPHQKKDSKLSHTEVSDNSNSTVYSNSKKPFMHKRNTFKSHKMRQDTSMTMSNTFLFYHSEYSDNNSSGQHHALYQSGEQRLPKHLQKRSSQQSSLGLDKSLTLSETSPSLNLMLRNYTDKQMRLQQNQIKLQKRSRPLQLEPLKVSKALKLKAFL